MSFSLFIRHTFTYVILIQMYTLQPSSKYLRMCFFATKYEIDVVVINVLSLTASNLANE